jgi:hypothetical protein
MGHLDQSSKDICITSCISIPVISCNGRKGYLVTSNSGTYLRLDGGDYWDVEDAYLHVDFEDRHDSTRKWIPSDEGKEVIRRVTVLYFAGKLKVASDLFRIGRRVFKVGILSLTEMIKSIFYYKHEIFDMFNQNSKGRVWWKWRINFKNFQFWKLERVEVVDRIGCPPLGGSWQNYFSDSSWIKEAEQLKGSQIYLT